MKILAYTQLLESYRSLTLQYMAEAFGVTVDYIDEELSTFIATGRLHCKIDRVGGIVETNRPDLKNAQFQPSCKARTDLVGMLAPLLKKYSSSSLTFKKSTGIENNGSHCISTRCSVELLLLLLPSSISDTYIYTFATVTKLYLNFCVPIEASGNSLLYLKFTLSIQNTNFIIEREDFKLLTLYNPYLLEIKMKHKIVDTGHFARVS
ncbi:hypothetical protein NQ317_005622 [Molorchus minor]|uniref:PCI domain-containing protein n=1 Tax=Molorchus minor TaxID=1323400 RepID=A0ABQ9K759_9CUCU|nr:hypothetical protein NQ317_005622 [Molorchus minor]